MKITKKFVKRIMQIFCILVLVAGIIFVTSVIVKGINTSFESTQNSNKTQSVQSEEK